MITKKSGTVTYPLSANAQVAPIVIANGRVIDPMQNLDESDPVKVLGYTDAMKVKL